jgi:hypothetical protein
LLKNYPAVIDIVRVRNSRPEQESTAMATDQAGSHAGSASAPLPEKLERGEVVFFPQCPFPLPEGADRKFLLDQHLASRAHKNIGFDPHTDKVTGFAYRSAAQKSRLHELLTRFSRDATAWLAGQLPKYAQAWQLDRVSFRPEEEATRQLRLTARNDLLHVDAFPSRPTNGWRILRLFANVNLVEPRVWVTSDPFAKLLERYGRQAGLPGDQGPTFFQRVGDGLMQVFRPGKPSRSAYDAFMLRFHNFMKANEDFQENCTKRFWHFPPNSAWMVMTDTASHAALRGRFALEHSYFISPESLALPEESPAVLLRKVCGTPVLREAA